MKQILIEVKPNSKQIKIEKITDDIFKIHLTAQPQEGKANKQLIGILSKYLDVPKSIISIKAGKSSRTKTIIIG